MRQGLETVSLTPLRSHLLQHHAPLSISLVDLIERSTGGDVQERVERRPLALGGLQSCYQVEDFMVSTKEVIRSVASSC
jgi:hypothetical protein